MLKAKFKTSVGVFEAELFELDAPRTVDNFCELARAGFYNGLMFFKHLPDVLVQTGCPNNNGTGGAGYFFPCELHGENQQHDYGVLSMAHGRRHTNSSQFFICIGNTMVRQFDGNHTCFGKVIENAESLIKIREGDSILDIDILQVADPPK